MNQSLMQSKIIEKQPNYCKLLTHQKNLIQYFCLDQNCFNKRLFCHQCAKINHKKHRIGRIDRLIQPLSLLNINSFHEDSQSIYEYFLKKIQDFFEVTNQLRDLVQKTLKQIEESTFFQVKCILETFSNQKIEQVEDLFFSANPDEQKVRNSVSMINFLQFQGVEDCYTVKDVSDILLQKMTKSVQKVSSKMEAIFDRLIKNVKQNDFINELGLYKKNLQTEGKKKMSEFMNNNCLEVDKEEESETFDPPQQIQQLIDPKNQNERTKNLKNIVKDQRLDLVSKFRAFFEEQEEDRKKSKKEKNVILVKKQYMI